MPATRAGAALADDPQHHVVVMFGGDKTGDYRGDTWLWNGAWHQVCPAHSPSPRTGAAMTYDPVRHLILLFGGFDGSELNDTWTWNGTDWTQQSPAISPPARQYRAPGVRRRARQRGSVWRLRRLERYVDMGRNQLDAAASGEDHHPASATARRCPRRWPTTRARQGDRHRRPHPQFDLDRRRHDGHVDLERHRVDAARSSRPRLRRGTGMAGVRRRALAGRARRRPSSRQRRSDADLGLERSDVVGARPA